MKDVYEDMEWSRNHILSLAIIFNAFATNDCKKKEKKYKSRRELSLS